MANDFLGIGAMNFNNSREELFSPSPLAKSDLNNYLNDTTEQKYDVYKKASCKYDLENELSILKNKYKTYLSSHSPIYDNKRKKIELSTLSKYKIKDTYGLDIHKCFEDKDNWQDISIPEYGGPVGYARSLYKKEIKIDKKDDKSYFIHFDCADYITEVFVNGTFVGNHEGFFDAFEFDITNYIISGTNSLFIILKNDYRYNGEGSEGDESVSLQGDKMYAATGPGYDDPVRGWHHCPAGMGLFGNIYIEERNNLFVSDIYVNPDINSKTIDIHTEIYSISYYPQSNLKITYDVYEENFGSGNKVKSYSYEPITLNHVNGSDLLSENQISNLSNEDEVIKLKFFKGENLVKIRLNFENFKLWSLDDPCLYKLVVSFYHDDILVDSNDVCFGMREFHIDITSEIKGMMYFNNSSIRLRGANTMGFEQNDVINGNLDLLYSDLLTAKVCNMNFLRLTQRPVQKEIYDMCDRIGLLIQTDLPLFTNIRRNKYTHALEECSRMGKHIRNHPSCVIASYINEPMVNSNNLIHRHLTREEMNKFFNACDDIMSIVAPNVAIKHIDGDYDAPDTTFPDNHCYCFWYNGHQIDAGKLIRGYWVGIKKNWYCGCGEYGSEGLDPEDLMIRRYPEEYLPTPGNEDEWEPRRIKDAQTQNMHYFFYSTPKTISDWVYKSQKYQAESVRLQTEALRRNPLIVSSALHLFIDAWPAGWMKTIIDCERNPKQAFFSYKDCLNPVFCSIRPDRTSFFEGEKATFETYICNDTNTTYNNCEIRYELLCDDKLIKNGSVKSNIKENSVTNFANVSFKVPNVESRKKFVLRMIAIDKSSCVLHYNDLTINVHPKYVFKKEKAIIINGTKEYNLRKNEIIELAKSGNTIVLNDLSDGNYDFDGNIVKIKKCGMRSVHFVSCSTNHHLSKLFEENDFRYWFDYEKDMITPIMHRTATGDNLIPILLSGNTLVGSAWQNPVYSAICTGELKIGKGKIIINNLDMDSHMIEPVCQVFKNTLYSY